MKNNMAAYRRGKGGEATITVKKREAYRSGKGEKKQETLSIELWGRKELQQRGKGGRNLGGR